VIGTGALRSADLVVRGEVERVSRVDVGVEMAVLRIRESLWGDAGRRDSIRVLTNEQGYFSRVSSDAIYFLKGLEGESRATCHGIVDLGGAEGPAKLAAVRRSLEVERRPAGERPAAVRALCFEGLGAPDAWTRGNAGRELAHLASLRPEALSEGDLLDLRRAAFRERDPVLRPFLVEAVDLLSRASAAGKLPAGDPGAVSLRGAPLLRKLREDPDPAERRKAAEAVAREGAAGEGALLEALAKDPAPAVRAAAAEALGTSGTAAGAGEALLRSAAEDGDPAVRNAAVDALGALRLPAAVPALRGMARDPVVSRAALFALARVRTAPAREALADLRREAAAAGAEGTREFRELVDFLLSPDFEKQEEVLRRLRGSPGK
jgi:hypothetical protein